MKLLMKNVLIYANNATHETLVLKFMSMRLPMKSAIFEHLIITQMALMSRVSRNLFCQNIILVTDFTFHGHLNCFGFFLISFHF